MQAAICLVAKNEASILGEWLAFNAEVGFSKFIIYDNGSSDGTLGIARAAARQLDIEIVDWSGAEPVEYQKSAYEHALANFCEGIDWIAFFDADEFFVPVRDGSLAGFLSRLDNAEAIGIPWAMFGSSGITNDVEGLVLESFTHRAEDNFGPNRHVKSMIRPGFCRTFINGHFGQSESSYVGVDGEPLTWAHPGVTEQTQNLNIARLNHYFTRSRSDWNRKIARGYGDMVRAASDFEAYDRNEVRDELVFSFIPGTRRRLSQFSMPGGK